MKINRQWSETILFCLPMIGLAGEIVTAWQLNIPTRFSFWVQALALLNALSFATQTYSRKEKDYSLIIQRTPLAILCVICLHQQWTPRPPMSSLSLSLGLLTTTILLIIWTGENHRSILLPYDKIAGSLGVGTIWLLSITYFDQIRLIIANGPGGVWWYFMYCSVIVAYSSQVAKGRRNRNPYLILGYGVATLMCIAVIVTGLVVSIL